MFPKKWLLDYYLILGWIRTWVVQITLSMDDTMMHAILPYSYIGYILPDYQLYIYRENIRKHSSSIFICYLSKPLKFSQVLQQNFHICNYSPAPNRNISELWHVCHSKMTPWRSENRMGFVVELYYDFTKYIVLADMKLDMNLKYIYF